MLCVLALGLTLDLGSKWYAFEHVAERPVEIDRTRVLTEPGYDPIGAAYPTTLRHEDRAVHMLPGGLLDAKLVLNYGAVFGLGERKRFFFIAFTIAAIGVGVLLFARWTRRPQRLAHVAIGFILAGGIGNLYDRIVFGAVRDFLHMLPEVDLPFGWSWWGGSRQVFPWVFNVADTMLLFGMLLLMIHINRIENRRAKKAKAAEEAAESGSAGTASE